MRNTANSKLAFLAIVAIVAVAMVAVYMKGHIDGSVGKRLQLTPEAQAAKAKVSPVKARGDRGVYYPNTENLGRNKIRVIACGTGRPTPRPAFDNIFSTRYATVVLPFVPVIPITFIFFEG